MRIRASGKTALGPEFRSRPSAVKQPESDTSVQTGTNLVLTEKPVVLPRDQRPLNRPLATFLTQLIAKSQNMPATRVKCRIDPAEGTKAYKGVSELNAAPKHG